MPSTQFNVRIDEEEKAAGDEAFASIDYSPSQIVQAVWSYAARNRRNKKALRKLTSLIEQRDISELSEKDQRLRWHAAAPQMYQNMLKELGVDSLAEPARLSEEELLLQAYLDKATERGMWV